MLKHGNARHAVGRERKICDPANGVEPQRRVEMREQGAAAGDFPFQSRAEPLRIDRDEQKVRLAGEMLRRRLPDLRR